MKLETYKAWFCSLLVLLCLQTSQAQEFHYAGSSPREFVEHFYNWYVPLVSNDQTNWSWDIVLKQASPAFSPELIKLLRGDAAAQAECNELVGLDFDPFLYSQDPAQVYVVGKIPREGQDYRAKIYSVDHGVQSKKPSLIAVFRQKEGRWFFVDFYYPSAKDDLLTVLKFRLPCSEPRHPTDK